VHENVAGKPAGGSLLEMKAEALCEIIMRHSETYENGPVDPARVAPLELAIAELTSAYRDIAKERTGVDIDFQQSLPELSLVSEQISEDDSEGGDTATGHKALPEDKEVFLVDKWYIRINSPAAIMAFARQRVGTDVSSPEEAARLLCEKEGWKPEQYPEGLINVLSHEVQLCVD
jgi:hypothetical protein